MSTLKGRRAWLTNALLVCLSAGLAALQSYYLSTLLPASTPEVFAAATAGIFLALLASSFVIFRLLSAKLPTPLFVWLLLLPLAGMAFWAANLAIPVRTAAVVGQGQSATATAKVTKEWNAETLSFYLHPPYGDAHPVSEISIAVPARASLLHLLATKPYSTVQSVNGEILGDGVELNVIVVSAKGSHTVKSIRLDPRRVLVDGWTDLDIPIAEGDREVRIAVTPGPPGSNTLFDLTLVAISFSSLDDSLLQFGQVSFALNLGALLIYLLSVALAKTQVLRDVENPIELICRIVKAGSLGVMALATVVLVVVCVQIFIWRHDEMYYLTISNYVDKFDEDGRWLNLILFPLLKLIPGNIALVTGLALFGWFAWTVARNISDDKVVCALTALLLVQCPPLYEQGTWPASTLPAYVLLAAAALLHRRLSVPKFYLLFSPLFFGTITQYYYLLPALHLGMVIGREKVDWRAAILITGCWIGAFVGGFVLVAVLKDLIVQSAPMQVAAWRNPNYVTDLASLFANLQSRAAILADNLGAVLQNPVIACLMALAVLIRIDRRHLPQVAAAFAICALIVLAHYAITLPIGISIFFRSVIATFFGVLVFAFVVPRLAAWQRAVVTLCALGVFAQYWIINYQEMQWFRVVTTTYYTELVRASPLPPQLYSGLIVDGLDARRLENKLIDTGDLDRGYGEPLSVQTASEMGGDWRWGAAANVAGFRHIVFCPGDTTSFCSSHLDKFTREPCAGQRGVYCIKGVTPDNYLVLGFNTDVY